MHFRLLPFLLPALLVSFAACDSDSEAPTPGPPRGDSIKVKKLARPQDGFCDVSDDRPIVWPNVTSPISKSTRGFTWLNLWATWCKPCVEEMPLLAAWKAKLASAGTSVELAFVSVDETDQVVQEFRAKNPSIPSGPRLADPGALASVFDSFGLDASAPIPVHVIVAPNGQIRCVRSGAVSDANFERVRQIVTSK